MKKLRSQYQNLKVSGFEAIFRGGGGSGQFQLARPMGLSLNIYGELYSEPIEDK